MALSVPTVPPVKKERRRRTSAVPSELQARVRSFAQELIEHHGNLFKLDPQLKGRTGFMLRRCLPPHPRQRGYPEVTRAIRMLGELHNLHPTEPYRSLWRRIYPAVIASYDTLSEFDKLTARQELRERVRWRQHQARRRARKRKTN